ncbi:hypothetical protein M419DRAFT_122585 [Trichoderma reesei RUT C-30]|uniref:Uncharacterized protein n=1 Tax=Hypocrea jecorina (strain ATCC 56765 / BCRC 32924 / NRRL 11460 / Rut C-30) TaxID=1344414 RepID=A0A024SF39_HYPJR|nr:hypothetical protein M419DRAFT_122585 [Trichoderma reesei RUT C-30]
MIPCPLYPAPLIAVQQQNISSPDKPISRQQRESSLDLTSTYLPDNRDSAQYT